MRLNNQQMELSLLQKQKKDLTKSQTTMCDAQVLATKYVAKQLLLSCF